MLMKYQIVDTFKNIYSLLTCNDKLIFHNKELFNFSDTDIFTPVGNTLPLLLKYKSKLLDHPVNFELLRLLINRLTNDQSIIRLNHIGFCYKVFSQEKEKERLIDLIKQTKFHLYQEKSNDDGLWLFVGNVNNLEEPLIELVPVEKTTDKWVDYWLPHIQIDIDTNLTTKEIENRVLTIFGTTIKPYLITIDGIVYIVRNHLGNVNGVNIYLDLATSERNVKLMRQHLLTRIDE